MSRRRDPMALANRATRRPLARHVARWIAIPRVVFSSVIVFALAIAEPGFADWELWLSPDESRERLDQQQTAFEPNQSAVAGPKIRAGQTFVPKLRSLYRMDFRVDNADDPRPGRIRLYRWRGSHQSTIGSTPLFDDVVDLSGFDGFRTQSFFPRLQVQPGKLYYVEFTARNRSDYRIAQSIDQEDPYPPGRALRNGRLGKTKSNQDLWFRTYGWKAETDEDFDVERTEETTQASRSRDRRSRTRMASDPRVRWFPVTTRPRSVSRRNYYERIQNFADRYRDITLSTCREMLHGNAMREAFLYRVSCEQGACQERRATDALAMLRNGHAWQFCTAPSDERAGSCKQDCDPEARIGFDSMDRPAMAYRWIRESPSLRPEDHDQIRKLLLDRARRFWPHRELGSHNRALTAAVGYRLVSDFFPDEPEAADWRAYARANWNSFWAFRDTFEDSAHYNAAVWWPAVLGYAQIAGLEDRIWSDPGFLALVDRFAKQTIPLGTLPNYGDTVGWLPDPSGLIWLFESAATHTRRADYRWLAHRIFSYSTLAVRDEWPRRDAFYIGHPALMGAYFAADDTLDPREPFDLREAVLLSRIAKDPTERMLDAGGALGTVFEAGASSISRIEVAIRNHGDERPARISLWRWLGSRAETIDGVPLFRDAVPLAGADEMARRSVFPLLDLEIGAKYYIQIERPEAPMVLEVESEDATRFSFEVFTLAGESSVVTERVRVQRLSKDTRRRRKLQYEFSDDRVPDKLVLRSGNDPEDMHAVFNLAGTHQHGQLESGALVSFVDGGSVIFTSGSFPYWFFGNVRLPQDESLPFVRRHWGGRYGEPGDGASVARFSDGRVVTVAGIRFQDPNGWQVRQERNIFFVKNRFMLVRDRFTVPDAMGLSVGPVWHARDLAVERGPDFFGVFNRQPLSDIWRVRNTERHALVYFVPRPGYVADAAEVASYLPPEKCPLNTDPIITADCRGGPTFAAHQRWAGEAKADSSRTFDTLIIPHSPKKDASRIASGVRVLLATDAVALEVDMGGETWLLVDNPSGVTIELEDLSTDAAYVVARVTPGRTPYLLTQQASRLRWRSVSRSWSVPTSVEIGAELPQRRLPGW